MRRFKSLKKIFSLLLILSVILSSSLVSFGETVGTNADMLSFSFDSFNPRRVGQIANTQWVWITVPPGTDVSSLTPTIVVSGGASVEPASGEAQDFRGTNSNDPADLFVYTVRSQNEANTKHYYIRVSEAVSDAKDILNFSIEGNIPGVIDELNQAISITVPHSKDVTALVPWINISPGATVSPATHIVQDFTSPVIYTVTAIDGSTKEYTVTVNPVNDVITIDSDITPGNLQAAVEAEVGVGNGWIATELHITAGGELNDEDIAYINTMGSLEVLNVDSTVTVGDAGDSFCASFNFSTFTDIPDFDKLREVTFPATNFGDYAFAYCPALETVNLREVTTFGSSPFGGCEKLKNISLPKAETFGNHAFAYCTALQNISLPEAIFFEDGMFFQCGELSTVSLPKVQAMDVGVFAGVGVFVGCINLETLILWETPPIVRTWGAGLPPTMSVYVPAEAVETYDLATDTVEDNLWEGWHIETLELDGMVYIAHDGTPQFGETLTADTSRITNNTRTLSYQWMRDGIAISGAANDTYVVVEEDINKEITVEVTSSIQTGELTSSPVILDKEDYTGPIIDPVWQSSTQRSITLVDMSVAYTDHEYSIDNGVNWQDSNVFTGLDPYTQYTFIQRLKETATHKASSNSNTKTFETDKEVLIVRIETDIIPGTLQAEIEAKGGVPDSYIVTELHITAGGELNDVDIAYINTLIDMEVLNVASTVTVGDVGDRFLSSWDYINGDESYEFWELREVTFPATGFGEDAFYNCVSLEVVDLPKATSFGDSAFDYCISLNSVSLPEAITFGESAFYHCQVLESIILPKAITFGDEAFYDCNSINTVKLPKVEEFGLHAFAGCTNLESLILGEVPPLVGSWGPFAPPPSRTVYVPATAVGVYDLATDPNQDNNWEGWTIGSLDLMGVVSINHDGTPQFGETLSADTSAITNNTGTLSYQWMRDGIAIGGATSSTYVVTEIDINKSITVEVNSSIQLGELSSSPVIPDKADYPGFPIMPTVESKTHNSITLWAVDGYEYRETSGAWQDSNLFTGLSADTQYTFYQRGKETVTHKPSDVFHFAQTRTDLAPITPLVVTLNTDITPGELRLEVEAQAGAGNGDIVTELHITAGGELNDVDIAYINTMWNLEVLNVSSTVTVGDVGDNFCASYVFATSTDIPDFDNLREVTFPATSFGDHAFSRCTSLEAVDLPKANSFGDGVFDVCSSLTNISLPEARTFGDYPFMLCTMLESLTLGDVPPSVGIWGIGLPTIRTVYVPAAAVETYDLATDPFQDNLWEGWRIGTFDLHGVVSIAPHGTPQFGETLTANTTGITNNTGTLNYQWIRNGTDISGATSSTYVVIEQDINTDITVVVTSSIQTGELSSSPVTPDKADYSGSVADPLEDSKSHNSITLTEVNGYEYKESNGNWQDSNIFAGLSADTAYTFTQRVKETATYNPSNESNPLDITTDTALVDVETPAITNNLTDQAGQVGDTITLDATATVSDGGTISYQWYEVDDKSKSNPQALSVTTATYAVNRTSAAISYYYCEVTNTNTSVNGNTVATVDSNVAQVTITTTPPLVDAETPVITNNLTDQAGQVGDTITLDATATVSDGGTISYQWYKVDDKSKSNPQALSVTTAVYGVDTSSAGTSFYYCEVTNTNKSVNGNTVATVDSDVAQVTITTTPPLVDAETPAITNNLTDQAGQVGDTITLDATATVSDGGTISYQWYEVDDKSKSNPQALSVTTATHTVTTTSAAISFYYCEVNNTNNSVNGNTVTTVDSNVAKVTITSGVPSTKSMTSYNPVTLTQIGDIANNNVQYQTANEVISALPTDITVTLEDGSTESVPVSWADTDGYDATTASNYTFTATWGALPSGVDNDDNISAPTCAIKVVKGSTGSGSSSNNSGSSGNNGRTSSDTPTPAYQVDVSSIETPSNKLSVNVDANTGNAEVDLGSIASNIFAKEGIKVVTMPSIPNVTDYTLTFPTVTESTSQGQSALTFSTEVGSITVRDNMFSSIPDVEGKKPSITIGQGNKAILSEQERAAIGDRPLVQLSLNLDGEKVRWNNPEAPVTVSIPYKPTDAELLDPEHIVIWYIDGQGKVISVPSGRYNSTTGTVTFDTTHFSYYAVAFAKKTFSDLNGVEWARKPIEVMASKSIINGTSTTTFSPSENITRADYLVLLINTLGLTADFDSNFDDVTPRDYYYEALGIAKELGISAGIGNNHFNPKGNISRQDMIVMTARALEKFQDLKIIKDTTVLDRFIDKEEISSYAIESLATMVKEGLISGSGNKLKPIDYSTRAEAAVFLYRIYNK